VFIADVLLMNLRFASLLLLGASLLGAGNCAANNAERALSPQQAALVNATCANIMRVNRSAVDMDACTSSLAESMAGRVQGEIGWQSDRDCSSRGLARGTATYSTCVLDEQRRGTAAMGQRSAGASYGAPPATLTYNPANDVDASERYYDASFETKRRREEYSCAQLGLDPKSAAFGQCVADLDASLFQADNPNP
jgi:hypothetical protein